MSRLFTIPLLVSCVGAVLGTASLAHAEDCVPPRLLFVVDASSSMLGSIPDGQQGTTTKWLAAQQAIEAVLTAYPQQAEYGLMTFPGNGGGCNVGQVIEDIGPNNGALIEGDLAALTIPAGSQTPAGQSLKAASQYALLTDPAYHNYVIFVTDGYQYCAFGSGDPGCVTAADCTYMGVGPCPTCIPAQPDGCYCVQDWPTRGAKALSDAGVSTYVVGFGDAVNIRALNKTAQAGGTMLPGCDPDSAVSSCYYEALVASELTDALAQIVQQVVTENCIGDCGIVGTRTCELSGWSACAAPSTQSCTSSCYIPGTQQCVNGQLTTCSSESQCGQGGNGAGGSGTGAGPTGGATPTGGAGGTGGSGASGLGTGNAPGVAADPNAEGNCGCRTVGAKGKTGLGALALLAGLSGIAVARRRRR